VLDVLGIRAEPARFELPPLPGRFQLLRRTPPVVIDAAHNADSARRLAAALAAAFPGVRFTVVLGVVQGKDVAGIFRELQPVAAEFVLTHPRNPGKGSELPALQRLAAAAGSPHRTLPELVRAEQLPGGAALLFTGSFFTALIGAELFGAAAPATAMVAKVRPAG
jgi:dihydrofolate synthase/folylpolyglutamate synthase